MDNTIFAASLILGGLSIVAYAAAVIATRVKAWVCRVREERIFNDWHQFGDGDAA